MASKKDRIVPATITPAAVAPVAPVAPAATIKAPAPAVAVTAAPAVAAPAAAVAATPAAPVAVVEAKAATAVAVAPVAARVEGARDRSTVVALINKLHDQDAEVARDAAVTLGTLPSDSGAVDALCDVVRNTSAFYHSVVRAAAASSLGKLGDKRAVDALIVGTGDTMAEASEEAVKALGLLGDARAVTVLNTIVRNEQNFYLETVRRTAEATLARIKR